MEVGGEKAQIAVGVDNMQGVGKRQLPRAAGVCVGEDVVVGVGAVAGHSHEVKLRRGDYGAVHEA